MITFSSLSFAWHNAYSPLRKESGNHCRSKELFWRSFTMRDPLPAPSFLVQNAQPIARALSLRTLPFHAHEILPSFGLYTFLDNFVAPRVSAKIFPQTYSTLSEKTKRNWDVHVVSLLQSCFINTAALLVIWLDKKRWKMGPRERVWGYTGATGMVQGFSAGYFLWDLVISATNLDVHGTGALAHAASALAVSLLGFVSMPRTQCLMMAG